MAIQTWLTERFDLAVPVVSAPMAGPADGALAAAVSAAGGLGMVGVGSGRTADWIAEEAKVAAGSGRAYGVGLMAWALEKNPDQLAAVLDARPALVSVSFGPFETYLPALHEAGIAVTTQAGNLEEALRAQRAGVDFLVARGAEAGGHGRNDLGTLALLSEVLDAVDVPVLAAGGIGTPRGLAGVLAAGAVGAWVGTAFLACPEAANSPEARARLIGTGSTGTAYGRVFDVAQRAGWPEEYGGRAVRNAYFDRWVDRLDELGTDDAAAAELADALRQGDYDTAYLYAGQGVGVLREERPAADVLADLARAESLLRAAE
ncbi:MAG TPA: nitronate monooxygenase [Nocardioidaceae bacterium]|jgi:nitronate monooxygenase|nr:nitronate monooxygenase [Nocardioidaceae bacterium]